jgi:hypothetical protein
MFNSDVSILSLVHACGSYPVNMIFDLIFGVLTPLMLDIGATVGSYLGSDYNQTRLKMDDIYTFEKNLSEVFNITIKKGASRFSFSVGGSRSTRREPLTMGKQLFVIYKAGREPMPY